MSACKRNSGFTLIEVIIGVAMVGIGIIKQSTANTIEVARAAKAETQRLTPLLPAGMAIKQSYDTSVFVEGAINEVYKTLAIAIGLVILLLSAQLLVWAASSIALRLGVSRPVVHKGLVDLEAREGRLALGTWQGAYLWEHRSRPHHRRVDVTILPL